MRIKFAVTNSELEYHEGGNAQCTQKKKLWTKINGVKMHTFKQLKLTQKYLKIFKNIVIFLWHIVFLGSE